MAARGGCHGEEAGTLLTVAARGGCHGEEAGTLLTVAARGGCHGEEAWTFLPCLHGLVSSEDRGLAKGGASGEGQSLDVFTVAARVVLGESQD